MYRSINKEVDRVFGETNAKGVKKFDEKKNEVSCGTILK